MELLADWEYWQIGTLTMIIILLCVFLFRKCGTLKKNARIVVMAIGGFIMHCFRKNRVPLTQESLDAMERRTILVTGGSRGLGKGLATQFAALGASVIVACRRDLAQTVEDIVKDALVLRRRLGRHYSGLLPARWAHPPQVEALLCDLEDPRSVQACVHKLATRGTKVNDVVLNAAVVPAKTTLARGLPLEQAFVINYLGHYVLMERLCALRVFESSANGFDGQVVAVSSEVHRISVPLRSLPIGEPFQYGMTGCMKNYAYTKLLVATLAYLIPDKQPGVFATALCPGPVNTSIARSAPRWMEKLCVKPMMHCCFKSPVVASLPIVETLLERTEAKPSATCYKHMFARKPARDDVGDRAIAAWLVGETNTLLARLGFEWEPCF